MESFNILEMSPEVFLAVSLPKIIQFAGYLLLIAIAWIGCKIAKKCVYAAFARIEDRFKKMGDSGNATLVRFLRHAAMAGVYFCAVAIVVSNIPLLDSGLNKLLAAGGVLALVLGVASQQALGSIAAGLMILFFKPFVVGNVVNVVSLGVIGAVEEITLNHTILKTIENKRVIIPNSAMNNAVVENFDYEDKRVCLAMDIGITYESDAKLALRLLAETVGKHASFLDTRTDEQKADGAPLVTTRVSQLADSAVVLTALLWGADNASVIGMRFDLMLELKEVFTANGVDLAYPHLVVVQKES